MSFISPKAYILFNCIFLKKNRGKKKKNNDTPEYKCHIHFLSWNIIVEQVFVFFIQGISFYRLWYIKDIFYGYESVDHSNITAIVSLYYMENCVVKIKIKKKKQQKRIQNKISNPSMFSGRSTFFFCCIVCWIVCWWAVVQTHCLSLVACCFCDFNSLMAHLLCCV